MTLNTQAMNDIHESAPVSDWRRRPVTRVAVCLLSWWACGFSYAADSVTFPSMPLQTGVTQPAPNVIFILDDSLSMTTQSSQNGDELDTGLTFSNTSPGMGGTGDYPGFPYSVPYTKNPLSYNPHTTYRPWATANTTDTTLVRLSDASYTAVRNSDQYITGSTTNFSSNTQTYYVPKPSADTADQRQYYRYQILSGGARLVRAEWVSTAPTTTYAMTSVANWNSITGTKLYWGNVSNSTSNTNGTCTADTNNFRFDVPAGVTRMVITTTGATGSNANPELYVRSGSKPCNTTGNYSYRSTNTGLADESITIDNPTAGYWYFGVYNSASGSGTRTFSGVTLTVQTSTSPTQATMGCSTAASGTYGWKNCVDITASGDSTTGVRVLDGTSGEKQNYANWYQYHRTRMKTAKAGGSEAFATLDDNYRVGLMGLYPTGGNAQVFKGSMANILPVASNGGLFVGANRKDWFDHLHGMAGKQYTPLRKALSAAGKYFATSKAYESTVSGTTTYLACRQNFTILTTDGYWNNFNGSDDPDSDYAGTLISGDEEDGATITGPNNQSYKYEKQAPYWYNINGSDRADDTTLADIAMHYWKTDLRTTDVSGYPGSAENRVPYSTANPAFWQHMVTFGVGLGVRGQLTAAQMANAVAGTGTLANGGFWPAPVHATGGSENPQNVDDLRHAALNARGSYVNANDSTQFARGITDALTRIGERRGSASNVLANSTSISTESFIFQATYMAGSWRGELLAYPISSAGLGAPQWRASEHIAAWGSRKIFTVDGTTGSTFPSSTQLTALGTAATTLNAALTGTELANYLKGDGSKEKRNTGGYLRDRTMRNAADQVIPALLGDIVDSSPFYVADNQTVFVGANDGMLHAIDASNTTANGTNTTGAATERFAYIPRGVAISQLAELADPLYGTNTSSKQHRFFVDGPIVVSSQTRTPGVNYLVGALGRGGKGVYGLNVTNPNSFGASSVLWDNTGSSVDDDMGYVISEPLISKLNNGVTAAVVANGPNSTSGRASLFLINLADGSTIHEFNTSTTDNGLSAPRAVDTNADGKVDFFFAGDLQGTMWRFDVRGTTTSSWTHDSVFSAVVGTRKQPISSAPGVARDPLTGKIWLYFGTGRYMTSADQSDTDAQTYYGIVLGTTGADGTGLTRADLDQRSIYQVDATTKRRAFEPAEVGIDASKFGWYIDLNNPAGTGERVISAPLLYDNVLIFSSIVPPSATTVNSCAAGGSGYINALDAFSGTSLDAPFFANIPLLSGLAVGSLPIDSGMPTAPIIVGNLLTVGDSSGNTPRTEPVNAPGGSSTRRVSWRELVVQ